MERNKINEFRKQWKYRKIRISTNTNSIPKKLHHPKQTLHHFKLHQTLAITLSMDQPFLSHSNPPFHHRLPPPHSHRRRRHDLLSPRRSLPLVAPSRIATPCSNARQYSQMPLAPPPLSALLRRLSSHPTHSSAFHATLLKSSSLSSPIPATALLTAYAKAGLPGAASRLFDEMPARDAVAWNALITCQVRHGRSAAAAEAFRGMTAAGFAPTAATLCTMLKACTSSRAVRPARQVHALTVLACHGDVIMKTALVDLYMSCGCVDSPSQKK
jgi:pentatricopeptide repeat protein